MKIIYGLEKFNTADFNAPIIIAIGTFDGVHLAHQAIIKKAVATAKRLNGISLILTFYPHPRQITDPDKSPALLTSIEHRMNLIAKLRPDICLVAAFKKRFARMSAEKFIREILLKKLNVNTVVIGDNFAFGKQKSGDIDFLKAYAKKSGFKVSIISALKKSKKTISSSLIRNLIESGKLDQAAGLLGRRFSVLGAVVKGDSRGRVLGYPTANIDPHQEALPPNGVYAVKARINNQWYGGMLNIGKRPTFYEKADKLAIEANLFNFNKYIYGQVIELVFIKKIRNEKKFNSAVLLIKQLQADRTKTMIILKKEWERLDY
ncbi:MAG: bifunctional riboflavin kinase/FAD synthetase [Candidatus Omnitrophica bacterium]|nr:bifunctional riboflavin kinase/FAD synthetase [Candidatus Omnitrophota bacterium]